MARNAKKRQKALQRKAAKRKQKKAGIKQRFRGGGQAWLRQAGTWPLYEVLLTEAWDQAGAIVQILVARQSPQGQIAVGTFLVDLGCLGVKSAFARLFETRPEYQELRHRITSRQPVSSADLNLVAKIIREGLAYADELGFKPDPDYRQAMQVLGEADPDACTVPIPLGKDGKPFFIAGPYDNVDKIMAKLTKKLGPDGFHFLAPIGPDTEVFLDEED